MVRVCLNVFSTWCVECCLHSLFYCFFALRQGRNFEFVRWEKYDVISTADVHFYVTLDAKDPASDSVFSFQTLLCDDSSLNCPVMWSTLACRIKCKNISPIFVLCSGLQRTNCLQRTLLKVTMLWMIVGTIRVTPQNSSPKSFCCLKGKVRSAAH